MEDNQTPDIDSLTAHHGNDTAASGMPAATGNAMANEAAMLRHHKKEAERAMWGKNRLKAAFHLVAVPSLIIGGASMLLSHASNVIAGGEGLTALQTGMSVLAGAAYYPLHRFVVEPLAHQWGRAVGNWENYRNPNLMFQQYTRPLTSTGAATAALALVLSHAVMMGPTYVEAAKEIGEGIEAPFKFVAPYVHISVDNPLTSKPAQTPTAPAP